MRDVYLERKSIGKYRIKQIGPNKLKVYPDFNFTKPEIRKFERIKGNEISEDNLIETTITKWYSKAVFALVKGGIVRLCISKRKINAVRKLH